MQTPISNQDFQKKPINLKYQIVHYLSKWYWFALGIIVCLLLASIYLRYAIPMYSASALILVKDDKKGGMVSDLVSLTEMDMMGKVKSTADNEIQIIKSRTIIEHAVKELELNIRYFTEGNIKTLELYRSTPIKLVLDNPSLLKKNLRLTVQSSGGDSYTLYNADEELIGTYKFGQQVKHPSSNFTILNTANSGSSLKVTVTAIPTLRMAQSYKGRISVGLVDEKTSVVSLTVTDAVPKRAEDFLNALIHNYNLDAVTDKGMIFKNTSKFIDERIALIEDELGAVEQSGENYKKSNQVTDIVSEAGMYLRNAGEYERMFIETETQLRVVESLRNFVQNSSPTDLIPDNILTTASTGADSSPTLIAEYNMLLLERARKLPSAGPENPNIKQLDAQLRALKQNVIANLDRLKSTLEIKKRDLQAQQRAVSAQISEVPTQEREYKGIVRQQNLKESLYLYLLQKREETAIALASTAPNAKIIDAALTATVPISPRVPVVYLGALFLGCLIPFGVIYLRDLMDTKIHSHSDLESLSLPYLGDVPTSDSHNEIITLHSRTSTAEALRIIRTNLEFMLSHVPETVAKTIFVTSTIPKEGKTFVSINLAATIALSGKKVLLLAMDIRNPKFDEYLKIPQKGLTNYISTANSEPGDFIVAHDTLENLHIFPAGVIPPNPAELLMDNRVSELFVKLQQEYEYIIVDTAPVSLVTDTQIIAKFAHSFVYVTRANHLDKNMLAIPERLYRENKLPNMAIVLNDTNLKKGYGYGYGQAYGYTDNVNQKWYTRFFKKK